MGCRGEKLQVSPGIVHNSVIYTVLDDLIGNHVSCIESPHPLTASLAVEFKDDVNTKRIYVVEVTTEKVEFRKVFSKAVVKETLSSDKILGQANAIMLKHPTISIVSANNL
jgi:hypothetical protein